MKTCINIIIIIINNTLLWYREGTYDDLIYEMYPENVAFQIAYYWHYNSNNSAPLVE